VATLIDTGSPGGNGNGNSQAGKLFSFIFDGILILVVFMYTLLDEKLVCYCDSLYRSVWPGMEPDY
jgi:hypothetical protein